MKRVFDYAGRSSRWEYWSFYIGFAVVLLVAGAWYASYQQAHLGLDPQLSDDQAAGIGFAFLIFFAAPNLALKVRRFHDFGWTGWAVLWFLVPFANIFFELMLLFRGPSVVDVAEPNHEPEPQHITIYNTPGSIAVDPSRSPAAHIDQIARLADMYAQGVLTEQEFAAAKARVLRA